MSNRLSFGMTPKTVRLPKHGEMLLSVHGSPLGVYKDDNLAAIRGMYYLLLALDITMIPYCGPVDLPKNVAESGNGSEDAAS